MIKSREYRVEVYPRHYWGITGLVESRQIVIVERTSFCDGGTMARSYGEFAELSSAIATCQALNRDRGVKPQEAHA